MEFGAEIDGTEDFFQMFWPTVLSHKIDADSPLWEISARDISSKQFEIVLTMEGTTPETGNTVQVMIGGNFQISNYILVINLINQKRHWYYNAALNSVKPQMCIVTIIIW